jgi:hypothetical protein
MVPQNATMAKKKRTAKTFFIEDEEFHPCAGSRQRPRIAKKMRLCTGDAAARCSQLRRSIYARSARLLAKHWRLHRAVAEAGRAIRFRGGRP